jgi:hypothetical protein
VAIFWLGFWCGWHSVRLDFGADGRGAAVVTVF